MKNSWNVNVALGTACLALALTITYACKDFLQTPPQGALDENALATKTGVEGSLIATYRSLDCNNATNGNWGCAASDWPFGSITSDEAYKGSEDFDQPQATKLELYAWSSDQAQDYLDRKWASMYEGVVRANFTLRLLEKVSRLKPLEISRADSASIAGEARFLRAHYHFEAWRMWGNIPYYFETDTALVTQGGFRKANDLGVDSVAKLIIADLDAAIKLLPATPRNGQVGRVTSWTARAYKGRVLVYTHQYSAAVATLDSVVAGTGSSSGPPYALETSFDHVWTGFKQRQRNDPRLRGIGQRRRTRRQQRQLWRAAQSSPFRKPVQVLRLSPAVAESRERLCGGWRYRASESVHQPHHLEQPRLGVGRVAHRYGRSADGLDDRQGLGAVQRLGHARYFVDPGSGIRRPL